MGEAWFYHIVHLLLWLSAEHRIDGVICVTRVPCTFSSNEVAWRILKFPIHGSDPPVQQFAVHLENGQYTYFTEDTAMDQTYGTL